MGGTAEEISSLRSKFDLRDFFVW